MSQIKRVPVQISTVTIMIVALVVLPYSVQTHSDTTTKSTPISAPDPKNWNRLYSVDPNDVKFFLYPNPKDEDYREKLDIFNSTSIFKSAYKPSWPLIILIHGGLGSPATVTDVVNAKDAYLYTRFEANIVMVDYSLLADAKLPRSLSLLNIVVSLPTFFNSFKVGRRIGDFIRYLIDLKVLPGPEAVHLVGLSQGCVVASKVGETIAKTMGKKIARISGLDCTSGQFFKGMLESTDAEFVDHTFTWAGLTGLIGNIGHVDFYINGGGPSQKHCRNAWPLTEPYCTHISSLLYFVKSIRKKNIIGCKCKDPCTWGPPPGNCTDRVIFGQYTSSSVRGNYYVEIPFHIEAK